MNRCFTLLLLCLVLCVSAEAGTRETKSVLGKLPLYFIENRGQLAPSVSYYLVAGNGQVYFAPKGVVFALPEEVPDVVPVSGKQLTSRYLLKLDFVNANQN